jgi:ABC-type multidrug transport system fused ATPase/permease subunit
MNLYKKWYERSLGLGLKIRSILFLIILSLIATVTEIFGVGMFLPIFQFMGANGNIDNLLASSSLWIYIVHFFNLINVELSLGLLLIMAFIFFSIRQLFNFFRIVFRSMISQNLTRELRGLLFDKYMNAKTEFQDRTTLGAFVNIVTTEVDHAILGIMAPLELVVLCLIALSYSVVLFFLSWEMTLISLIVFLIASYLPRIWIREGAKVGRKLVDANTLLSSFLIGRVKSPRLPRLSRTENIEKNEFKKLTLSQCNRAIDNAVLAAKTEVSVEPFVIAISLGFLFFAYTELKLNIEIIGLYLLIILRVMPVIKGIISQWHAVQRWIGSIEIVEKKLAILELNKEVNLGKKELTNFENISFKNVSYSYPETNLKAIDRVSFEISARSITAIVGPSGSGKSTLIDLIPRLRIANSGEILIDDHNIKQYTSDSLRKTISYVSQGTQIFDGEVIQHIRYGKQNASLDEVHSAAKLSGAYEFIKSMPQGFETRINDGGIDLSGGERQRLDIARAIIGGSKILILDEPTSGLDSDSKRLFNESITTIQKNKPVTIIIVTHDLSSIKNADNIIVLKDGILHEEGNHKKLLLNDRWYASALKKNE